MPGFHKCPSTLGRLGVLTLSLALAVAPFSSALAFGAPPADAADPDDDGDEGDDEGEADPNSPDGLSASAVEAFEAKDYDTAIELFEKAYDADPNPNYLFNIGRVFEEKGDLQSAIDRYERFVKSPGVDLESRKFANERLRVLREIVAGEDEAKKPSGETTPAGPQTDPTGPQDPAGAATKDDQK